MVKSFVSELQERRAYMKKKLNFLFTAGQEKFVTNLDPRSPTAKRDFSVKQSEVWVRD